MTSEEIKELAKAQNFISPRGNDPITPFSLITKAINIEGGNKEIIAKALYDLLVRYGFLKDTKNN